MDTESGETKWIDTSSKKIRQQYKADALRRQAQLDDTFRKSGG